MAEKSAFYESQRQELHQILPLDSPLSANVEVSSLCNIRCKYCRHSLGPSEVKKIQSLHNMDLSLFTSIVKQFEEFPHKIKKLVINGVGEPLCNPDFPKMLAIAKQSKAIEKVEFFTNATLLTPELSQEIIQTGVDRIKISLQGLSSEKYREICGVDIDYISLYKNIQYLASIRQKTELFIKIIDIGLEDNFQLFLSEYFFADKLFMEYVQPWFAEINYEKLIQPVKSKTKTRTNKYGKDVNIPKVCPIPFYRLYINADGDVYYCYSIRRPAPVFNCRERSIMEIWKSEQRRDFLRSMLRKERKSNEVCCNCTMMCDAAFSEKDNLDLYTNNLLKRFC